MDFKLTSEFSWAVNNNSFSTISVGDVQMGVYKFKIFDRFLYVFTQTEYVRYIEEYIESILSGNPDKDAVITSFSIDTGIPKNSIGAIRIVSDLEKIEINLKPILEAIKRDKKIDDLLKNV